LSEVFDDYQLKKVVNKQIESMKKIYENQDIKKEAIGQKFKHNQIFSMSNDEDINEEL
jgi:hypothetical protein